LFGGFTPAICTYLIQETGNRAVPAVWLGFSAVCGLAATLILGSQDRARQRSAIATAAVGGTQPVSVNLHMVKE
jgi:hypothetical protein